MNEPFRIACRLGARCDVEAACQCSLVLPPTPG
jgi:hypothetical protein